MVHGGGIEDEKLGETDEGELANRCGLDQMTIMVESSRTFLWTEYARTGCGCLSEVSTDPKVWDKLPVSSSLILSMVGRVCYSLGTFTDEMGGKDKFSSYPGIKDLLKRVKDDKEEEKKRLEYYHDPSIGRFSS